MHFSKFQSDILCKHALLNRNARVSAKNKYQKYQEIKYFLNELSYFSKTY